MQEMRALLSPRSELSDKRRQVEQLTKDVERARSTAQHLADELGRVRAPNPYSRGGAADTGRRRSSSC
jgi:hypothetical protein